MGAYGILENQRTYDPMADIRNVMKSRGIHDFSIEDVDTSDMTWDQRRRTRNSMDLDDRLFKLEGGVSDEVSELLHKRAK